MLVLEVAFQLCDTSGFLRVMYIARLALNIMRFVVPIILVAMLIMDLAKNVINPEDQEGKKKIVNRVVATIIIFLIPTFIDAIMNLFTYLEIGGQGDYTLSRCYTNATRECIDSVENYLNCTDFTTTSENSKCQTYRRCNSYELTSDCRITTSLDDTNCSNDNTLFFVSGESFKE